MAACGGGEDGDATGSRSWERAQAMSLRRSYIAAAEVAGSIYAAGGMVGETGRPLAVFQRFDPRENRWTTLRRLPEPVRAGAAAALGWTIYVTGGQTPRSRVGAQVYAYDLDAGTWSERRALPEARYNHSAVTLDGTLYVLGGFAETEQDEVFAYDASADRWRTVTRLPQPMHAFGAVAFRGELWTIGGLRGDELLSDVWIWSPRTNRWRRGPAMPEPMELLGAAVAGDEIHAVWEGVYQVYDASRREWRRGPPLEVTRHGLEAFAVDGALYAIGGCTTALRDSPVVERIAVR